MCVCVPKKRPVRTNKMSGTHNVIYTLILNADQEIDIGMPPGHLPDLGLQKDDSGMPDIPHPIGIRKIQRSKPVHHSPDPCNQPENVTGDKIAVASKGNGIASSQNSFSSGQ